MAQMRPPEDVLYAFSQWLQQWSEYALSQARQFAASTSPGDPAGDVCASGSQPASQENQPPAHWLELVQPGPPVHWLALFDEYGLEPPKTEAALLEAQADGLTLESAPRPLQDWLGEFQRGLTQFAQPQASLAPIQDTATTGNTTLPVVQAQSAPGKYPGAQGNGDGVEPTDHATSGVQAPLPVPRADTPALQPFSQAQNLATGRAQPFSSADETEPKRRAANPGEQENGDGVEPAASATANKHGLNPAPHSIFPAPGPSVVQRAMDSPRPAPPADRAANSELAPAPGQPAQGSGQARPTPFRLRLNPQPPGAAPAVAASPLPATGEENARPALSQSEQVAPRPRLHIGLPTSPNKPPSVQLAPPVDPVSQPHASKPAPPPTSFAAPQNSLPQARPGEVEPAAGKCP